MSLYELNEQLPTKSFKGMDILIESFIYFNNLLYNVT